MKKQKRIHRTAFFLSLFICGIIVFWGYQVFGQEWTAEQKEVWKAVEADTELFKQGDVDGILGGRHDDVAVWWGNKAYPLDKNGVASGYKRWFNWDKPVKWELEPYAIKVIGNVAVVFYTWKWTGKSNSRKGRKMNTYIKQDNRWLLIGSLNADCDKPPPCGLISSD
jgi:ketosteroid isomerase-like protein